MTKINVNCESNCVCFKLKIEIENLIMVKLNLEWLRCCNLNRNSKIQ